MVLIGRHFLTKRREQGQLQGLRPCYTSRIVKSLIPFPFLFLFCRFRSSLSPELVMMPSLRSSPSPPLPRTDTGEQRTRRFIQHELHSTCRFRSSSFFFSFQFSWNVDTPLCLPFPSRLLRSPFSRITTVSLWVDIAGSCTCTICRGSTNKQLLSDQQSGIECGWSEMGKHRVQRQIRYG
jgi:hypothetical protein